MQPSGNAGWSLKAHYLVVIFLHESAAHCLDYILLLAGRNMQYNQVSIVATEGVYWGNRGLKALL